MSTATNTAPAESLRVDERVDALVGEHADTAWTLEALQAVWEHQHDRVSERIDSIERAIDALADGRLDADMKRDAERAAHMLAGSLGMFGFIEASDAAHILELALSASASASASAPDSASDRAKLSALAERLRDGVQGPVILCSDAPVHKAPIDRAHSTSHP